MQGVSMKCCCNKEEQYVCIPCKQGVSMIVENLPLPQWIKNTDPYKYEFWDGSLYLFAVLVHDKKRQTSRWEVDTVRASCDGEQVRFTYVNNGDSSDEEFPYDGWDFEDVQYFMELDGTKALEKIGGV